MRLSEVLSRQPTLVFKQVEDFLGGKPLITGKQRKIHVGEVALNYFCKICNDIRTFRSCEEIYCIGVNEHLVSIDSVLCCHCGASVQVWYLVDCDGDISGQAPDVRILKRSEKLSSDVLLNKERYGEFSELLEKAQRAHHDRLGAGAMVYLRKIFEKITLQTAMAAGIPCNYENSRKKPFKVLLEEVDKQCSIIPKEFSADGYRLFGELSDIVHGTYDDEIALIKYDSLNRLVVGILDNVKNSNELKFAIGTLGWNGQET